jgi:hypothetical protein
MTEVQFLLAHGSRNPQWRKPFEQIAEKLQSAHPERQIRFVLSGNVGAVSESGSALSLCIGFTPLSHIPIILEQWSSFTGGSACTP